MSVTNVEVIGVVSSSISMNGSRKYTVSYRVDTDDRSDQSITAMSAAGIPSTRDHMSVGSDSDTAAFPINYSANLQDSEGDGKTWIVLVNFEASMGSQGQRQQDNTESVGGFYEAPWDMPARINGHGIETQVAAEKSYPSAQSGTDEAGSRYTIFNAAGDPPPGLLDKIVHKTVPSLTIEKDFETWPENLEDYADTLNLFAFFGKAPGTYRMGFPVWSKLYTGGGQSYYNVTFEFYYDRNGWNDQTVTNAGFNVLDDYLGTKTRATDSQGLPTADPVNLDEDGYQLEFGEPSTDITFHPYASSDFGLLGIPTERDGP